MTRPYQEVVEAKSTLFRELVDLTGAPGAARTGRSLRSRNIVAMDVGEKLRDGYPTGELCVRVYVRKKTPHAPTNRSERIPKTYRGVPVDVLEAGSNVRASMQWHPRVDVPLKEPLGIIGGASIGTESISGEFGTAGAVVSREGSSKLFLLTNKHVVSPRNTNTVIQPGNATPLRRVGQVVDEFPIDLDGEPNVADAALVELNDDVPATALLLNQIGTIIGAVTDDVELRNFCDAQTPVQTYGAGTQRVVRGLLVGCEASVPLRLSNGRTAWFEHQLTIQPNPGDPKKWRPFAKGGDSGSVVVHRLDQDRFLAVGLLFAVMKSFAFAAPLKPIVERFKIKFA